MDHHCVVLGNWIGHHNIRLFFLLHLYTFIAAFILVTLYLLAIFKWRYGSNDKLFFTVQYVFPLILSLTIGFGSFSNTIGQFYLNLINKTQLEMMLDYKTNIFNSGSLAENLKASFGNVKYRFQWILPFNYPESMTDGHTVILSFFNKFYLNISYQISIHCNFHFYY